MYAELNYLSDSRSPSEKTYPLPICFLLRPETYPKSFDFKALDPPKNGLFWGGLQMDATILIHFVVFFLMVHCVIFFHLHLFTTVSVTLFTKIAKSATTIQYA